MPMTLDYDPCTEHKCLMCGKITNRRQAQGWEMAANIPFHYVCSKQCASDLKDEQDKDKDAKKALKQKA